MAEKRGPVSGHETSDLRLRPILWFFLTLAFLIAAILLAMGGLFDYFSQWQERTKASRGGGLVDTRQLPPEPRLQVQPAEELEALRREEERLLNTYGWVDPQQGIVRIPIERAMELLLERGLPARTSSGPAVQAEEAR